MRGGWNEGNDPTMSYTWHQGDNFRRRRAYAQIEAGRFRGRYRASMRAELSTRAVVTRDQTAPGSPGLAR